MPNPGEKRRNHHFRIRQKRKNPAGNPAGRKPQKKIGAKGYRYAYDTSDRILTLTAPDDTLIYKRTYNKYGELTQQTDSRGSGIHCQYDYAGRKTEEKTSGNRKQQYRYDPQGNLTATTDGNKNPTQYRLDPWGRILEIQKADKSTEQYTYDHAGNLLSATDGEKHTVTYRYNTIGKMCTRTDASGKEEHFYYDIEGRLCRHIDRNQNTITYRYNMYHNPTMRQHTESGLQEVYGYEKDGKLSHAIGGGMRYNYTYYPDGTLKSKEASGKTLLSYTYDFNRNKTSQQDITGKTIKYTYNLLDLPEKICDTGGMEACYNYESDGTIKSQTIGKGITTHYAYDMDKT